MDILNLPKFNIVNIAENEHDFQIRVETNSPPLACPHCGCVANMYKYDNREQLCMDLPIHGKRVGLLIRRQRYRCRDCNQTLQGRAVKGALPNTTIIVDKFHVVRMANGKPSVRNHPKTA